MLRRSKTVTARLIQRLSKKGLTGIGATATPFWNSPLDTVGSARALNHEKVPFFSNETSDSADPGYWVVLLETDWEQLSRDRSAFEGKAQRARQDSRKEAGQDPAQVKILEDLETQRRMGRWLGGVEDSTRAANQDEAAETASRNEWRGLVQTKIANPIRTHLGAYTIRHTKNSVDLFGHPVVSIPNVHSIHHRVDLTEDEQAAYDAWTSSFTKSKNPKAQNLQILARKLGIDPHFAIHKWFDPQSPLSPKTTQIVELLTKWQDENRVTGPEWDRVDPSARPMKPIEEQSKIVLHTHWTSQIPVLLNRLAQNGFSAKAITGDIPPNLRQAIVADLQTDADHLSDPTGWFCADNQIEFYPPPPCRILIITSVGAAGINLFRANHLILVDLFFTHQERVQVVGRIARKGQNRACYVHSISIHNIRDDLFTGLAGSKGMAASALFGNVGTITSNYESGAVLAGDVNPLALPEDLVASLQTTEATRKNRAAVKRARDLERRLAVLRSEHQSFHPKRGQVDGTMTRKMGFPRERTACSWVTRLLRMRRKEGKTKGRVRRARQARGGGPTTCSAIARASGPEVERTARLMRWTRTRWSGSKSRRPW